MGRASRASRHVLELPEARVFPCDDGSILSSVGMAAPTRKKLLFVDDDLEMHAGMRFILDDDYDLTCVISGEEAVAVAASEVFPAVLLDLQMNGLSGLETLKLLLKAKHEPQKVIILTGNDTKESAIQALNLGAFRYLVKPFQKEELHETLQAAFERYRFERDVLIRPKQISSDHLQKLGLSKRRVEIALLATQGESNREIATQLKITERTVEKQMQGIFSLLNVSSRAKLAAKIIRMGVA
jgi:DNA-binding NarL/FixJ family response regulator